MTLVHLHLVDAQPGADLAQRLLGWLTPAERARIDRLRQPDDRVRSLVARAAARALVARDLGVDPVQVELTTEAHGKPCVRDRPDVQFSIAHSGACVAVALADVPVGVDLEVERDMPDAVHLAQTWFTPAEAARIAARPQDFLPLWTTKEAVLKTTGSGLSGGLARFAVPHGPDLAPLVAVTDPAFAGILAGPVPIGPGYHAALGIRASAARVQVHRHGSAWLQALAQTGSAPLDSETLHG